MIRYVSLSDFDVIIKILFAVNMVSCTLKPNVSLGILLIL